MRISWMTAFILFFCFFSAAWSTDFEELASTVLEEIWSFHPIGATHLGVHRYDARMPDYSKRTQREKLDKFRRFLADLDALDTVDLSLDERVDRHLLRASLYDEIFDIEKNNTYENDPLLYSQCCINGVYTIMIRHYKSIQDMITAVTLRLEQIPPFLETARQNLKKPSYILCDAAINQLNEGERFIEEMYEHYKDSLDQEMQFQLQQAKTKAVASMMLFSYWLQTNQDPDGVFIMGEENYNSKLRNVHLADITADSILKIGTRFLELSAALIDSLDGLLKPPRREMVVLPSDFGPQAVAEYRRKELRQLREYVAGSGMVTIPESVGEIEIVETPDFMAGLVPGPAMMPPGPFDESRSSYFYMPRLPVRFEKAEAEYFYNYVYNRWFRGSAVHEAYPGHHLQISISNNHPSFVRKSYYTYFHVEGWALYCEEMMALSGYYEDTIGAMINALEGVRYRAARAVVDVKLQTGIFGYEDALRFMVEHFGGTEAYYSREVKRYISSPIQPSSYLIGKLQILDLLAEYRERRGRDFDLKEFHDALLGHGSIPIKLARMLMLEGL
jgi:uncharacterized protein (DUF885 family)